MNHLNLITLFVINLLLSISVTFSGNVIPQTDSTHSISQKKDSLVSTNSNSNEKSHDTTRVITQSSDSILKPVLKDSLYKKSILENVFHLEFCRRQIFNYDSTPDFSNPYHITTSELYRKNATAFPEAVQYHPMISSVKFGISNSINKFLLYGSIAPVNKYWSGPITSNKTIPYLFPISSNPQFSTETEEIALTNTGIHYLNYPVNVPAPEEVILWENGVFNENILDLRFSRPLTKNLTINVFSNYHDFSGTKFSHQSNNIYSFYSGLYKDSTQVSDSGYNPKVSEHTSGAQLTYIGNKGNLLNFQIQYSDLLDEIALNQTTTANEQMYQLLHRYPIELSIMSNANQFGKFFLDLNASYLNQPITKIIPDPSGMVVVPLRSDGDYKNVSIDIRPGFNIRNSDSIGISASSTYSRAHRFNDSLWQNTFVDSRLFYKLNSKSTIFHSDINGGINLSTSNDSIAILPVWHVGFDLNGSVQKIRAYFEQENIPYTIPFDSLIEDSPLLDNYLMAGLEYSLHAKKASLLLGYQYLNGIDNSTIEKSWPQGVVPYEQARSVILVSPEIGRWHGLSLSCSGFFSDKKPYVKIHSNLSYVLHPLSTSEFIDINLGYEYWSDRDSVEFAGRSDWNKAFSNVNLEISAHIHSFRLFYKVDNLLNRKFAYVPGYYNSGLTFRWGFNWFIQR